VQRNLSFINVGHRCESTGINPLMCKYDIFNNNKLLLFVEYLRRQINTIRITIRCNLFFLLVFETAFYNDVIKINSTLIALLQM
jgi:hypothetical protein